MALKNQKHVPRQMISFVEVAHKPAYLVPHIAKIRAVLGELIDKLVSVTMNETFCSKAIETTID